MKAKRAKGNHPRRIKLVKASYVAKMPDLGILLVATEMMNDETACRIRDYIIDAVNEKHDRESSGG